ncbi:hypothetical protein F4703DRAFT_1882038 [Phycomyces blakesleeanus]
MTKDSKDVWAEMKKWQDEFSAKDSLLSKIKPINDQVLPNIRKPTVITLDGTKPAGIQSFMSNRKGKQVENKPTAVPLKKSDTPKLSRTDKALAEKEKGNAFFRAGDNKNAALHYGNAIDLDPTTAVYFVNRAMAYLKLKNYLEAEKDCSRGLQLQPCNVKALWRRGTALRELGRFEEARKDLELALELEPGSKAIVEELAKIPIKKKPSTPPVANPAIKIPASASAPATSPVPKTVDRRRLPIKVVDEYYSNSDKIQPLAEKAPSPKPKLPTVSVKPADNLNKPSVAAPVEKPSALKQSTSRISVVESSQEHTLNPSANIATSPASNTDSAPATATTTTAAAAAAAVPHGFPTNAPPVKLVCPRTNFEFERDWKTCKHRGDDMLYNYLQCIPPSSYATLFKSSLESDQFEKMIEILDSHYIPNKTGQEIVDVLSNLSKVKRIDMLVMFLDKKHIQALQRLFEKSKGSVDSNLLTRLSKVYSVKL